MFKSLGLTSDKILLLSGESLLKGEDKKNTIHKSGSSNLLVDKTKSVVKLIIFVFTIALKVVLPNSKICVSEKSVLPNSVWSMLTKLFRIGQHSLLYKGQWRGKWIADSTSLPQCILKAVFEFMFSQMAKSKSNSCYIFDLDRIMAIKKRIRRRLYEF